MPGHATDALLRTLFESSNNLPLSFEVFPPRTPSGRATLLETVARLSSVAPASFSVTMGAGGSSPAGTHETAIEVAQLTGLPVTAHLTGLGRNPSEVDSAADSFWSEGITRILALRGDRPRTGGKTITQSFAHAAELVSRLRARHDFEIWVAAYPEKHPESASLDSDIDHLREKLDAGATTAICQFTLNPDAYGRFLDACGQHGIGAPIVPGLMPLSNWGRIRRFARSTGTTVPSWLERLFEGVDEVPELRPLVAMAATLEHLRRLIAYGAPAIHVYTLNHWKIPLALAHMMGRTGPKRLPVVLE